MLPALLSPGSKHGSSQTLKHLLPPPTGGWGGKQGSASQNPQAPQGCCEVNSPPCSPHLSAFRDLWFDPVASSCLIFPACARDEGRRQAECWKRGPATPFYPRGVLGLPFLDPTESQTCREGSAGERHRAGIWNSQAQLQGTHFQPGKPLKSDSRGISGMGLHRVASEAPFRTLPTPAASTPKAIISQHH